MIRLLLVGPRAPLQAALDWLHVRTDVAGVIEHDDAAEVFLGEQPAGLPAFAGVEVTSTPCDDAPTVTGLEDDRAFSVGDRILVRPPWVERPREFEGFDGIELVVPRGMAFGSGEHDSTQAALLALDAIWPDVAPSVVVDVGTGSGILAHYAATRAPAARIVACDVEASAVAAAIELLPHGADVRLGGPDALAPLAADLVVANLTGAELAAALDDVLAVWARSGELVLSGMRSDEVEPIVTRVAAVAGEPSVVVERGAFTATGWSGGRRA